MGAPAAPPPAAVAPVPAAEITAGRTAKNALYVELGGNGGIYSVNYERFLIDDGAVRLGLMYMSIGVSAGSGMNRASSGATWLSVPLMFNYYGVGSENHKIELGGGLVFMHMSAGVSTFDATAKASGLLTVGTASIGYRYAPAAGGINFKIAFTPLFFFASDAGAFLPWAGLSFGYGF
jgi:hypothetical protein